MEAVEQSNTARGYIGGNSYTYIILNNIIKKKKLKLLKFDQPSYNFARLM